MNSNSSTRAFVSLPVETSHGTFLAHYSEKGLARLDFPPERELSQLAAPSSFPPAADWDNPRSADGKNGPVLFAKSASHFCKADGWQKLTSHFLKATLANKPGGKLPPLDLSVGTDFQRRVWAGMQKIKQGETMSYGELAAIIGQPKAVRAVGGACGANPIPVLIPCHRVLAANKKIGGFSGGLKWKEKLLVIEGIILA